MLYFTLIYKEGNMGNKFTIFLLLSFVIPSFLFADATPTVQITEKAVKEYKKNLVSKEKKRDKKRCGY